MLAAVLSGDETCSPPAMLIEAFTVPPLDNNVYFVVDEGTREALVVDTALGSKELVAKARELGGTIKYILNTHGHHDHVADNEPSRVGAMAAIGLAPRPTRRETAPARWSHYPRGIRPCR